MNTQRISGLPAGSVISCAKISVSLKGQSSTQLEVFGTSTGTIIFLDNIQKYTDKYRNVRLNGPIKSLSGFQKELIFQKHLLLGAHLLVVLPLYIKYQILVNYGKTIQV